MFDLFVAKNSHTVTSYFANNTSVNNNTLFILSLPTLLSIQARSLDRKSNSHIPQQLSTTLAVIVWVTLLTKLGISL